LVIREDGILGTAAWAGVDGQCVNLGTCGTRSPVCLVMMRTLCCVWVLLVSACAAQPLPAPISVRVVDAASGEPILGAKVVADVASHDHPFSVATLLGETGPVSSSAFTDELGLAMVTCTPGRAVRIGVLAVKYPVLIQLIDEPWLGRVVLEGDVDAGLPGRRLRATVEPATTGEQE